MRHYTLYNICKTMLLVIALLAGSTGISRGQEVLTGFDAWPANADEAKEMRLVTNPDDEQQIQGKATKVIYIAKGQEKEIRLQSNGDDNADQIDGFIHWYVTSDSPATYEMKWTTKGSDGGGNGGNKYAFKNGLSWLRKEGNNFAPFRASAVMFKTDAEAGTTFTLICDASASNKATKAADSKEITTPEIALRYTYEIRVIETARVTNVMEIDSIPVHTNFSAFKQKFVESYEIHTPLGTRNNMPKGTNYRLSEPMENYYIPTTDGGIAVPSQIRWRAYNPKGEFIQGSENIYSYRTGLNKYTFSTIHDYTFNTTEAGTYYLTAEVGSSDNGPWYAASLLTVHLDNYLEPLTEEDLETLQNSENAAHYKQRFSKYLTDHQYENIANITFEEESDKITEEQLKKDLTKNYSLTLPDNVHSYYAFTDLEEPLYRRKNRLSVGRGEFGLYRTLNYPDVSTYKLEVTNAQGQEGTYNDYFMDTDQNKGGYAKVMVDRSGEKSNGSAFGYFMYLDATDDPGTIATIDLKDLCSNTTLIVSAWVCDMAYKVGVTYADVGFTFKARKTDGTERILTKYYSGKVGHRQRQNDDKQAAWQQLFFTFTFDEVYEDEEYFLEIANNTVNSNGADYGIDDIQVYRSTPDISVERKNACDVSTLVVQSDYETVLRNMGWTANQDIFESEDLKELKFRKYRYGLMGNNPYADVPTLLRNAKVGNVYLGFAYNKNGKEEPYGDGDNPTDWVTVNKLIEKNEDLTALGLHKNIRVIVPTNMQDDNTDPDEQIPTDEETALRYQVTLNVRAMNDFIADTKRGPSDDPSKTPYWTEEALGDFNTEEFINNFKTLCEWNEQTGVISSVKANEIITNTGGLGAVYEKCVEDMYAVLKIPRIRCPWQSTDHETLHLCSIDVENTDLRYLNEQIWDDYPEKTVYKDQVSVGTYWAVLFSAKMVAGMNQAPAETPEGTEPVINLGDACTLKSLFIVRPAQTILIGTENDPTHAVCTNTLKKISATLNGYDENGNPVDLREEGVDYIFDWFLGPLSEYTSKYAGVIEAYRDGSGNKKGVITQAAVQEWIGKNPDNKTTGETLIELLDNDLLKTGTMQSDDEHFTLLITEPEIVAIPYIISPNEKYEYCSEATPLTFRITEDTPEIYPGLSDVTYPTDMNGAPLRLGWRHLTGTMTIPIRPDKVTVFGEADALGLPASEAGRDVSIREGASIGATVGQVTALNIKKADDNQFQSSSSVTIAWNADAQQVMREGKAYELLIPFVQMKDGAILEAQCDGLASLTVKVVPEYLTWKGESTDVWYGDTKWNQSAKSELYMGNKGETTANVNGSSTLSDAFSPLYFSKITIPVGGTLTLKKEVDEGEDVVDHIRYDMAIDTVKTGGGSLKINPYYINKVSEIYFKPEALLVNQHYLEYDTARVEFEMTAGTPYWMSSPLKDTYAGDMYAPFSDGLESSPAFGYITYNKDTNHRWKLPFYQKAWNKAIAYSLVEDPYAENPTTTPVSASVAAVASNWSIEYNDVWVPYSEGKGFYARVEGSDARVRLPKKDTEYTYDKYATKATKADASLENHAITKDNYGRLAGDDADNSKVTVQLSNVYGDDTEKRYLVGNPYMSYLNMRAFFEQNSDLEPKYWTLQDGSSTATVANKPVAGTPDIEWTDSETEEGMVATDIKGYVKPMRAFFVELKDAAITTEIVFTSAMMASKPTTGGATTRAVAASNPALTLTAERGDARSRALLATRDNADNGYKADEDAVVLLDSELDAPMVYTVSGGRAAQVNAVREIKNVGLGVYGEGNEEVTLTIEGLSRLANPLYLYDAQSRESVRLEGDSYSLTLDGGSHGRYFLRDAAPGSELENTISIYSARRGEVIVSALRPVRDIQVFGLNGAQVRRLSVNTTRYRFDLPAGIYVIHASDGETEHTEKVIVR